MCGSDMPPRERFANSPVGFCSEQPAAAGTQHMSAARAGGAGTLKAASAVKLINTI